MKNIIIILIPVVLPVVLQAQEKDAPTRFTEFRTDMERANSEWNCKITDEKELHHYMLQFVTSKEKSDSEHQWVHIQVLDKITKEPVQEFVPKNDSGSGDSFLFDDYNFDGYEDFSLFSSGGVLCGSYGEYYLFDPETGTFSESGFEETTNLQFDSDKKTITSHTCCCAGTEYAFTVFTLRNNKMALLEEYYLTAAKDEKTGEVLLDEKGAPIFEKEYRSAPSYVELQLQSVGLKKNFRLQLVIYDENMAGGVVQYSGQTERIPIHFDHQEIIEDRSEEGRPNVRDLFYNEMYRDEINGVYVLTVQGARFYNAKYIRKKDGKTFRLDILSDI